MNREYELSSFIPDFYLLAGHGCGRMSFLYYLSLIGAPSSRNMRAIINKSPKIGFPIAKTINIYRRGITCDRALQEIGPISFGDCKQKIIQIIRDPIDQLTSFINYCILNSICASPIWQFDVLLDNGKISIIKKYIHAICYFASLRKMVQSTNRTLYIDTNELHKYAIYDTMKAIQKFLILPNSDLSTLPFDVSSGSADNMIWGYQQQLGISIDSAWNDIKNIAIFPERIHDIYVNNWKRSFILDIIEYNNEKYIVSIPEHLYYQRGAITRSGIWDDEKKESLKRVIDIFLNKIEFYKTLYSKYSITWEDMIRIIRNNSSFLSEFANIMKEETSLIRKDAPKKLEAWTHFNSL